MTDTITMVDTDTVTGPGTYTNIVTATATNCTSRDNLIRDCKVAGVVTVG